MSYLKMLGIAMIAMAGFMAFVGVGPASATTLCTATDTPDCVVGHIYLSGTTIDSSLKSGSSNKLTSGGSIIATCTGGTILGKTTNASGTYVEVELEEVSWNSCSQTVQTVATGKMKIDWTAGTHNGRAKSEVFGFTMVILGVSCSYGAGEGVDLGALTSGSSPELDISATFGKTAGSFLCPATVGWEATWSITSPHALSITT